MQKQKKIGKAQVDYGNVLMVTGASPVDTRLSWSLRVDLLLAMHKKPSTDPPRPEAMLPDLE